MEQAGENMYSFEKNSFIDCKQKFYVVNREGLNQLKNLEQFDGGYINNILIDNLNKLLQFTANHEGFCSAITKARVGKTKFFWFPMLFYKKSDKWIRVRIETTICSVCGWKGDIANPTLPDLYETSYNKFELIKAASQIETTPCPKCKNVLKRHAIWVGMDDNRYERNGAEGNPVV